MLRRPGFGALGAACPAPSAATPPPPRSIPDHPPAWPPLRPTPPLWRCSRQRPPVHGQRPQAGVCLPVPHHAQTRKGGRGCRGLGGDHREERQRPSPGAGRIRHSPLPGAPLRVASDVVSLFVLVPNEEWAPSLSPRPARAPVDFRMGGAVPSQDPALFLGNCFPKGRLVRPTSSLSLPAP